MVYLGILTLSVPQEGQVTGIRFRALHCLETSSKAAPKTKSIQNHRGHMVVSRFFSMAQLFFLASNELFFSPWVWRLRNHQLFWPPGHPLQGGVGLTLQLRGILGRKIWKSLEVLQDDPKTIDLLMIYGQHTISIHLDCLTCHFVGVYFFSSKPLKLTEIPTTFCQLQPPLAKAPLRPALSALVGHSPLGSYHAPGDLQ